MKKEWADKWISALRSGQYKQGREFLCANDQFCCLGVLCDLSEIDEFKTKEHRAAEYLDQDQHLPEEVMRLTGMVSTHGSSYNTPDLTVLNDEGSTFLEIADIIEKNWDIL